MASLNPHNGTLGKRLAKHLLRRATYKYTKQMVDSYSTMTADAAVDALFNFDWNTPLTNDEPIDPGNNNNTWINSGSKGSTGEFRLRDYVRVWFLNEAINDETARFKMMFFLHGIFCIHSDMRSSEEFFDYVQLLRYYAQGSYKELALAMTKDNMMMDYLDNEANTRWNPNENYAREFLELFTIGKGPQAGPGDYTNYTEQDVLVGAKLLSGWRRGDRSAGTSVDPVTGLNCAYPEPWRHETGDKTFSAAFNNQTIIGAIGNSNSDPANVAAMESELQDYVDMIFDQDETAKHIVRKIYRQFVARDIDATIESDIIAPLATTFRNNNYDLGIVMKQLLKSQHFFGSDDGNLYNNTIGRIIKSPLDNIMQTLSFFEVILPDHDTNSDIHYNQLWRLSIIENVLNKAGLELFRPPSVAGYPAYYQEPQFHRNWFSSSTIVARYKLPDMLVRNRRLLMWGDFHADFDIVRFVQYSGVCTNQFSAAQIVEDIIDYLCVESPDTDRLAYFEQTVLDGNIPEDWTEDWGNYVGGVAPDDSTVRTPLESFFKALVYSPEYQVM